MSDASHRDGLPASFAATLSGLSAEREARLLSILSHNLTVSVRGVYADKLDAELSLRKLYGLNEIQHRVSGRLMYLSGGDELWEADSFVKLLVEHAEAYDCVGELLVALKYTLPHA